MECMLAALIKRSGTSERIDEKLDAVDNASREPLLLNVFTHRLISLFLL